MSGGTAILPLPNISDEESALGRVYKKSSKPKMSSTKESESTYRLPTPEEIQMYSMQLRSGKTPDEIVAEFPNLEIVKKQRELQQEMAKQRLNMVDNE